MPTDSQRPVLVFDGDCSFCRMWVAYWQELTGDRVEYAPYQSASGRFADVPVSEFQKAVQLFENGSRYSGAEAVFHLVSFRRGGKAALWAYHHVPGVAIITEALYRFIAAHRNAGYRITRALWGPQVEPAQYTVASSLFARAIAIIYMIAFISFGRQVRGLIGAEGVQPVTEFFTEVVRQLGASGFWQVPTIFWWVHSEFGLESIVWGGAVIAGVAAIGRPHTSGQKAAFVLLFIYYLSIVNAGQIFMSYQWDFLLLEAGFLAIFLKPVFLRVWLFRWLLFRLMFESGAVKLLSHDPSWRNLTALAVHYQTQPLPTPIAWYMMQLPLWFQKASTALVFVVELGLPFLIFGPRRLKQIAAFGIIALQTLILLTGNYTFFNLLTIALCFFLFDDAFFRRKGGSRQVRPTTSRRGRAKVASANRRVSVALFVFIMILSVIGLAGMFGLQIPHIPQILLIGLWIVVWIVVLVTAILHGNPAFYRTMLRINIFAAILYPAVELAAPFGIVNQYGLFATMTTSRPEISIEGSNDGADWRPYVFPYKPGPLNRAPGWAEPFQPRLDWQMWFAALGNYRENPWLLRFMMRLLQGSPPVLELIEHNPFGGKPPQYIRAMVYEYRFTTFEERRQTGNWWKRELKGTYFPPISLRPGLK